jgi:hypothetical protein
MTIKIIYGNRYLGFKEAADILSNSGCQYYSFPLIEDERLEILKKSSIILVKEYLTADQVKTLHELISVLKATNNDYVCVFDTYNHVADLVADTSLFIVNKTLLLADGNSVDESLEIWLDRLFSNKSISVDRDIIELLVLSYLVDFNIFYQAMSNIELITDKGRALTLTDCSWLFPTSFIDTWKKIWLKETPNKFNLLFGDKQTHKHIVSLFRFFIEQRFKEFVVEGNNSNYSPAELIDSMITLKNSYTLNSRQFNALIYNISGRFLYGNQENS